MSKPTETQELPDLAATSASQPVVSQPVESGPVAGASKLILNFGHPLSDQAKEELKEVVGLHTTAWIKVQIDLNQSVGEQVFKLCREAVEKFGRPDYVIPPGHALAAIYVDRFFSGVEGFPPAMFYTPIIRLVMIGAVPPTFAFGGIE